jgi:hypothetical protein
VVPGQNLDTILFQQLTLIQKNFKVRPVGLEILFSYLYIYNIQVCCFALVHIKEHLEHTKFVILFMCLNKVINIRLFYKGMTNIFNL